MATITRRLSRGPDLAICKDSPMVQRLSDGGVRLELTRRDVVWVIDLSRRECEEIAQTIGRRPAWEWPRTTGDR